MAEHTEIGKIGEKIMKDFLLKHGFYVICANYRTKHGEIDIIAEKDNKLRFVEVKSVKVRNFQNLELLHVKPEDNLTFAKWKKIAISTQIYLHSRGIDEKTKWQIDLGCIYVNTESRVGKVVFMENIHKE